MPDLEPREDVVLQLDVTESQVDLWVWQWDAPMPDAPQLTRFDSTYAHGAVGLAYAENPILNQGGVYGVFRYIEGRDRTQPLQFPQQREEEVHQAVFRSAA